MKMLMILTASECRSDVEAFLKVQNVPGYTEIPTVYGEGHTGPKFGSWAFPGTSTVIFTVVPEGQFSGLMTVLKEQCAKCRYHVHILSWYVDMVEIKK